LLFYFFFFFSSRRRHTRSKRDWSSDVCSSDLNGLLSVYDTLIVNIPLCPDFRLSLRLLMLALVVKVSFFKELILCETSLYCGNRSEERRVGKECRYQWWRYY